MRLLTLPPDGVQKLITDMEKEVRAVRKNCLQLGWYFRGSVSYTDVMNMSTDERKIMNEIIDDNLETTKKTQLPFF